MNFKHIELDHLAASLPNLDDLDPSELDEAEMELQQVVSGLLDLVAYAQKKSDAMRWRKEGSIALAMRAEALLDSKYKQLPDWAQW